MNEGSNQSSFVSENWRLLKKKKKQNARKRWDSRKGTEQKEKLMDLKVRDLKC